MDVFNTTYLQFQIVKESYPDHTQFERKDPHYDR